MFDAKMYIAPKKFVRGFFNPSTKQFTIKKSNTVRVLDSVELKYLMVKHHSQGFQPYLPGGYRP